MTDSTTKLVTRVRALLERGERISPDDCRDLFGVKDITTLARLARIPHERRFGRRGYYRNAFIAEYRGEHADLFMAELETVLPPEAAGVLVRCRWRGGESLDLWKERLARFVAGRLPCTVALSPGFIVRLAAFEGIRPSAVLEAFKSTADLLVTAEEAELFNDAFRADCAPGVISVDEWAGVHRAAHALGLETIAGMTYSTIDHPAEYAEHLAAVRKLQDETGGFAAFAPMALHNRNVDEFHLAAPTAAQTLRTVAVARIFLDNIQHVAVAPALMSLEVAVVALNYGADLVETAIAVDDVHAEEHIGHDAASLPIVDPSAAERFTVSGVDRVRERLNEARWTPVALHAAFTEAAPAVAA